LSKLEHKHALESRARSLQKEKERESAGVSSKTRSNQLSKPEFASLRSKDRRLMQGCLTRGENVRVTRNKKSVRFEDITTMEPSEVDSFLQTEEASYRKCP